MNLYNVFSGKHAIFREESKKIPHVFKLQSQPDLRRKRVIRSCFWFFHTAALPMVALCVTDQWRVRGFRKHLQFQSAILVVQEWLFSPIYVVII